MTGRSARVQGFSSGVRLFFRPECAAGYAPSSVGKVLIAVGLSIVVGTLVVAAVQAGLRGVFELQPSMLGLFGGFGAAAVGGCLSRSVATGRVATRTPR